MVHLAGIAVYIWHISIVIGLALSVTGKLADKIVSTWIRFPLPNPK